MCTKSVAAKRFSLRIREDIGSNWGFHTFQLAVRRAAEEPVAGLRLTISGPGRGAGLGGGGDGGQGACGAAKRVRLRMREGIGYNWGFHTSQLAVRRAAEEPVAGLAAGILGPGRGAGLGGGGDGGQGACGAAKRVRVRI